MMDKPLFQDELQDWRIFANRRVEQTSELVMQYQEASEIYAVFEACNSSTLIA